MNLKNNLTVLFKSIEFEDEWLSIQISSDIFNILFILYSETRYNVRNTFAFHRSVTSFSLPCFYPPFPLQGSRLSRSHHSYLNAHNYVVYKGPSPDRNKHTPFREFSAKFLFFLLSTLRISIKLVARAPRRSVQVSRLCVILPEHYTRFSLFVLVQSNSSSF